MITEQQVLAYIGEDAQADVPSLMSVAQTLVNAERGNSYVPENIIDQCVLLACAELNQRRTSVGGIVQYAGIEQLARLSKDPMNAIRSILSPWVVRF